MCIDLLDQMQDLSCICVEENKIKNTKTKKGDKE